MDQGLAGLLGALVGALATGGGAQLAARSSERLHKRQARRESYLALLRTLEPFLVRALEVNRVLVNLHTPRCTLEQLNTELNAISEDLAELRTCAAVVALEGPAPIRRRAGEVASHATSYLSACYGIRNSISEADHQISEEQKLSLEGWEMLLVRIFALFQANASRYV
jgi:hypothetical protein